MKISIIITSYNQETTIEDAINSCLNQTLKPFEIIVCDDASTDSTKDKIRRYEKTNPECIRVIFNKENQGVSQNRNTGIIASEGEYITWLDGDDIFLPTKLADEGSLLIKDESVQWVYSQVEQIAPDWRKVQKRYKKKRTGYIFEFVVKSLGKAPRNPMVSKKLLMKVGLFDPNLEIYEDYDLMLRISLFGKCAYNKLHGMEYRINEFGLSRQNIELHLKYINMVEKKIESYLFKTPKKKREKLLRRFTHSKHVFSLNLKDGIEQRDYCRVLKLCIDRLFYGFIGV